MRKTTARPKDLAELIRARQVPAANGAQKPAAANAQPAGVRRFLQPFYAAVLKAQRDDGGWGAGRPLPFDLNFLPPQVRFLYSSRLRPSDPTSTAFAGMAILAGGNTLDRGEGAAALRKATEFLLKCVERIPDSEFGREGLWMDDIRCVESPFGSVGNTSATAQYFARCSRRLPTPRLPRRWACSAIA